MNYTLRSLVAMKKGGIMKIIDTQISEVKIIEPQVFGDARGFFYEGYQNERYYETGIKAAFVQDNLSRSCRGVVRGLHYQMEHPQGKLVSVIRGEVFDVAVDVRLGSPTFGKWVGVFLNDINHHQLYIPEGFAHGFCVLSEEVDFYYKCTDYYYPKGEQGVLWNDKSINITWPLDRVGVPPILSQKDLDNRLLSDIPLDLLPKFSKEEQN